MPEKTVRVHIEDNYYLDSDIRYEIYLDLIQCSTNGDASMNCFLFCSIPCIAVDPSTSDKYLTQYMLMFMEGASPNMTIQLVKLGGS